MFDEKKAFELMERESEILDRLASDFGQLDFVWAANDQLAWIRRNSVLLVATLSPAGGSFRGRVVTLRADVLFHLGNYLASASAGLDFLFNHGKTTFDTTLLNAVDARARRLKESVSHRIMTALRNRQQHAPPVIDRLIARERTRAHPEGEGIELCPRLSDRALAHMDEKVHVSATDRWHAIKSALEAEENWLVPLLEEHWAEVKGAFDDCQTAVRSAYQAEVDVYDQLRKELEAVKAEYRAMGLIEFP